MAPQFDYGTVSNPEEAQRLGEVLCQCFNSSISTWPYYFNKISQANFRVIRRDGEIAGGLAILHMGQYFGRQSIPMAGIASVGVPPEHRGTGVAAELLTQALKELQANGIPLSTLYAATQVLYRKVGYEQAGICCRFELPTESIRLDGNKVKVSGTEIRRLPIRRVLPKPDVFQDLYQQWAIQNNGNLDRNQVMWKLLFEPQDGVIYAYLIGSEAQPEGYIIFSEGQEGKEQQLLVRDWVALTPAAGQRLWTFLADHRSIVEKVMWRGPAFDPLLLLLSEQTDQVRNLDRWLLRVVDVPKALEQRGYPADIETDLHFDIRDDLLLENNGRFVLTVSGGQGKVTRGGRGELQINVRVLAPLYTGLFTPHQLQLTGQIDATQASLSVATQLFTGPEPWMSNTF